MGVPPLCLPSRLGPLRKGAPCWLTWFTPGPKDNEAVGWAQGEIGCVCVCVCGGARRESESEGDTETQRGREREIKVAKSERERIKQRVREREEEREACER